MDHVFLNLGKKNRIDVTVINDFSNVLIEQVNEIIKHEYYNRNHGSYGFYSIREIKNSVVFLKNMINKIKSSSLKKYGLKALVNNNHKLLLSGLKINIDKDINTDFLTLLNIYYQEQLNYSKIHDQLFIEDFNKNIYSFDIYLHYPTIADEIRKLATLPYYKDEVKSNNTRWPSKLEQLVCALRVISKIKTRKNKLKSGFYSFMEDNFSFLIECQSHLNTKEFNSIVKAIEIYCNIAIPKYIYNKNLLHFYIKEQDTYKYLSLDKIKQQYPLAFEQIKAVHQEKIASINPQTLKFYLTCVNTLINESSLLKSIPNLTQYGFGAFAMKNGSAAKYISAQIKNKLKNGKLKLKTAKKQIKSLKWFLSQIGISFPIELERSINSIKQKYRPDQKGEIYTDTEIGNLLSIINKAIDETSSNDNNSVIILNLAKIWIMTGWNQTPLLSITMDDIDTSIKGEMNIKLIKKRGHSTHTCKLTDNNEQNIVSCFREVIANTNILREKTNNNTHKKLLFLYKYNNEIKPILGTVYETINTLLKKYGSKIKFTPRRIRKTMANFVKEKTKNDNEYTNIMWHSIKTANKHYLIMHNEYTDNNLSIGIKLMVDELNNIGEYSDDN